MSSKTVSLVLSRTKKHSRNWLNLRAPKTHLQFCSVGHSIVLIADLGRIVLFRKGSGHGSGIKQVLRFFAYTDQSRLGAEVCASHQPEGPVADGYRR